LHARRGGGETLSKREKETCNLVRGELDRKIRKVYGRLATATIFTAPVGSSTAWILARRCVRGRRWGRDTVEEHLPLAFAAREVVGGVVSFKVGRLELFDAPRKKG